MDDSVKTQQLLISYAMQKGGWKNMPLPQDWIQITHNTTILYINVTGCTILDIHPFKYLALGNDKEKKAVKSNISQQYDPKKRNQSYISCWATCPFPEIGWIKLYHVMKNSIVYYHAQSNTLTAKHPCRTPKHSKSPSLPPPPNNDKLKKAHSASIDINNSDKPKPKINNNNASKYHRYRATTTPQDKQTQNKPRPSLFNLVKTQNAKNHKHSKSAESKQPKSSHKSPKKKHKSKKNNFSFKHRRNAISDKESAQIKESLSPKSKAKLKAKLTKKERDRDKKKKMFQFLTSNDDEDEFELKLFNQEQDEETILQLSPPTMDIFIEKDIKQNNKHNKGKRGKYGKSQTLKRNQNKKQRHKLSPSTPPPRSSKSSTLDLDDGFNIVPSFLTTKSTKLSSSKSSSNHSKGNKKGKGGKGKKKAINSRRTKSSFESHEITGGHSFNPKKKSKSFKLPEGEKMEKSKSSSPRKAKSVKYRNNTNANAKTLSNSSSSQSNQRQKNKKPKPKQSKTSKLKKKSKHSRDRSKTNQFFSDSGTSSSPIPKNMTKDKEKKFDKKRTSSGPNGSKQSQREFKRFHVQKSDGNNSISTRRQRPNANVRRTSSKNNKYRNSKGVHARHNISIASMSKVHKHQSNKSPKKSEQEKQRRKKDKSSPRMNKKAKSAKKTSNKHRGRDRIEDTDDEMPMPIPMPSAVPRLSRGSFSKDSHHNKEYRKFSLEQLESKNPLSPTAKTRKMIKKTNKKLSKNERERKKVKFKISSPTKGNSLTLQKRRSSKSITPDSKQSTKTQERTKSGFPSTYTRQRSKSNKFHRGNKIDGTPRSEEEKGDNNNNDNSNILTQNKDGPKDLEEMIAIIKSKNKEKQSQPKQQFASSLNAYNWGKTNLSALNNSSYTHSLSKSVYVFQASRANNVLFPNFSNKSADSKSPRAHASSPRGYNGKSRKMSNGFSHSLQQNKRQSREKKTRSNSLSRIRRTSESSTDSDSSSSHSHGPPTHGTHGRARSQRGIIKGRFKIASPNKRRRNAVGMNATNIQQQLLANFGGETSPNGDSSPSPEANAQNGFVFVSHGSKASYADLSILSPKSLPSLSTNSSKSPRYKTKIKSDKVRVKDKDKDKDKENKQAPMELESDDWKQFIAEQPKEAESMNMRVRMSMSPSPSPGIRSQPTTPTLLPQSHSLNKDNEDDKDNAACVIDDDDEDFTKAPTISQSKSDPVQMSPLITPTHPLRQQTSPQQTSPQQTSPQALIDSVLRDQDHKDDKDEMDGMTVLNYRYPNPHHDDDDDDDDVQSDLDLVEDDMIKSNMNVINGSNSDEDHETGSIIFNDAKLNNSMIKSAGNSPNRTLSIKSKSGSNIIDGPRQHQGIININSHRTKSQKRYRNTTDGDLLLRSMTKNAQNAQIRSDSFRRFSKSSKRSHSRRNVHSHGHRHRKTSRASSVSSTSSVSSSISDVDRSEYIGSRSRRASSSATTTSSDDSSDDESSISSVSDSSTDSDDSSDDDNMSVSSNDSRRSRASSRASSRSSRSRVSRNSLSRNSLSRSTTPSRRNRGKNKDSNTLNARFTNSQNITDSLYNRMADMMLMMSHHSHSTNTYNSNQSPNHQSVNSKLSNHGLTLSPNSANIKGWVNMNGILSPPSIAQSAPNSNYTQFGFSDPSMFSLDSHGPNGQASPKKMSNDSTNSNHSVNSNNSAHNTDTYKPQQFDDFMKKFMAGFNQSHSSNATQQDQKSNTLHSYDSFASQRGHINNDNNNKKGMDINTTSLSLMNNNNNNNNISNDSGYKNRIASIMLTNSYADDTSCSASDNDMDSLLDVKSV